MYIHIHIHIHIHIQREVFKNRRGDACFSPRATAGCGRSVLLGEASADPSRWATGVQMGAATVVPTSQGMPVANASPMGMPVADAMPMQPAMMPVANAMPMMSAQGSMPVAAEGHQQQAPMQPPAWNPDWEYAPSSLKQAWRSASQNYAYFLAHKDDLDDLDDVQDVTDSLDAIL